MFTKLGLTVATNVVIAGLAGLATGVLATKGVQVAMRKSKEKEETHGKRSAQ